jgi:hypothetical protein
MEMRMLESSLLLHIINLTLFSKLQIFVNATLKRYFSQTLNQVHFILKAI